MTPIEALGAAFAAVLTVDFLRYWCSGRWRRHWVVFRGHSPGAWLGTALSALAMIGVLFAVALALMTWGGPILRFSWLVWLATPADGPVAGTNLNVAGARIPGFGLVFLGLLALNIPRLARLEEEIFRRDSGGLGDVLVRSVKFGLVHCLVGVPVAVGLALTLTGFWLTLEYRRGGVRRSTFAHAIHNFLVLGLLTISLVRSSL